MDKEKIALENVLIILDDIALPLNKLRLRPGGNDGGHNGLKSINEVLGTKDYPRLRFGIGSNYPKGMQADFVLSQWKKEEEPLVKHKIDVAIEVIETFAFAGLTTAMNQVNNKEISL
jgi:PTH1 family peptidyl-tRNA hydrolase